jgi:hypothetical protein
MHHDVGHQLCVDPDVHPTTWMQVRNTYMGWGPGSAGYCYHPEPTTQPTDQAQCSTHTAHAQHHWQRPTCQSCECLVQHSLCCLLPQRLWFYIREPAMHNQVAVGHQTPNAHSIRQTQYRHSTAVQLTAAEPTC